MPYFTSRGQYMWNLLNFENHQMHKGWTPLGQNKKGPDAGEEFLFITKILFNNMYLCVGQDMKYCILAMVILHSFKKWKLYKFNTCMQHTLLELSKVALFSKKAINF